MGDGLVRVIEIVSYSSGDPLVVARVVKDADEDAARIEWAINDEMRDSLENEVKGAEELFRTGPARLERGDEYMDALMIQYGYGIMRAEDRTEEEAP
jgi:hypothetical protein